MLRNINMFKESFLSGAASILELLPSTERTTIHLPIEKDEAALASDWAQVGHDLKTCLESNRYEE